MLISFYPYYQSFVLANRSPSAYQPKITPHFLRAASKIICWSTWSTCLDVCTWMECCDVVCFVLIVGKLESLKRQAGIVNATWNTSQHKSTQSEHKTEPIFREVFMLLFSREIACDGWLIKNCAIVLGLVVLSVLWNSIWVPRNQENPSKAKPIEAKLTRDGLVCLESDLNNYFLHFLCFVYVQSTYWLYSFY